jgi:hypothetical protein
MQEDLIQETATRLFGIWTRVDRSTSPWPLTATIALNLVRDQARSHGKTESLVADHAQLAAVVNVEESGIARFELSRVRDALGRLTTAQREALIEDRVGLTPSEKMLRLRARKKLKALVERVPMLVWLRARRAEPAGAALIYRDGIAQTIACVACALFGAAAIPLTLTPGEADAHPVRLPGEAFTVLRSGGMPTVIALSDATYPHPQLVTSIQGRRVGGRSGDTTGDATPSVVQVPAAAPLPVDPGNPTSSLPVGGGGDAPVDQPPINAGTDPNLVFEQAAETVEATTGVLVKSPRI